ncbi:YggT family protein [Hyphococcus luteus]|uniref:YggT family protein n=1 Tax=Hyphococcus luteus TaxID=2058213 RepID=A0A2S7K1Z8_9PROT|nr:YggT family protein [Marinicaulis flavus]PQA86527.1 YggT family protein [Marinicaulis flavus]
MAMIAYIVNALINLYVLVLFVTIILSLLISFNVVNRHNQFVDMIYRTGVSLTEPLLRPVRNMLPAMGGIDISPIIVLILVRAVQIGLNTYVFSPMISSGL